MWGGRPIHAFIFFEFLYAANVLPLYIILVTLLDYSSLVNRSTLSWWIYVDMTNNFGSKIYITIHISITWIRSLSESCMNTKYFMLRVVLFISLSFTKGSILFFWRKLTELISWIKFPGTCPIYWFHLWFRISKFHKEYSITNISKTSNTVKMPKWSRESFSSKWT